MTITQSILLIIGFTIVSAAQAAVTYYILRSNDALWRTNRHLSMENIDLSAALKLTQQARDAAVKSSSDFERENKGLRRLILHADGTPVAEEADDAL